MWQFLCFGVFFPAAYSSYSKHSPCAPCMLLSEVLLLTVRKRGHDESEHHPFDCTKFSDVSTLFDHKEKEKAGQEGWKARMGTSSPLLPMTGIRTLSSLGGGSGGHFYPGRHVELDGVGRRRTVRNVLTSRWVVIQG